jgi:KUP system potassium uptake protein
MLKLSYCPQVKVVHTSRTFHGQLFVPFLNWLLLAGTILVTAVYSNTTRLGNAYGACVMFVTFFDTCMCTLVALIVWRIPPWVVLLPWLFFACLDGLYLSSALVKVPDGAWFTLTVSGVLACLFLLWRFGKETQWRAEAEDRFKLGALVARDPAAAAADPASAGIRLTERWGGDPISRIRGFGIYFDKTGVLTPTVFSQFVSKFVAVTDVSVFFHLHPVEAPSVADDERFVVLRFREVPGCYRLVVRHGFMDEVISPDLAALVYAQVRAFVLRQALRREDTAEEEEEEGAGLGVGEGAASDDNGAAPVVGEKARKAPVEVRDADVAAELARLDRAYAAKIMYVVGKEQMRIKTGTGIGRKVVLGTFLWIRDNTRAKIANLRLAMERVVEVGFVKEI